MILGMIDLTTHDEKTLRAAIEGQVLDDSKNTIITKEEDGFVNFISYRKISNHDSVKTKIKPLTLFCHLVTNQKKVIISKTSTSKSSQKLLKKSNCKIKLKSF